METLKKENELNLVAQQYIINLTNEIKNKMNDFFNNSYNYRYNYYVDPFNFIYYHEYIKWNGST